ncbi:hypothetical protein BAUCODRAFT_428064 [Baudoinia panamericana UAMH 10762]|uniref:Uncharacterized protein n=1 Tax=Baudoinia panamericana (strain UAMH 10762) TaxID=717646 RepID=M2MP65_BAUPA|nr:uncharacterized protein BAUCODRAFT_428064 [Baudoinia panamericana UAMH 10762]EMC98491.1 hypothetical protein BAUCODRAFT_428064 [Baudoinia panamericana UAMH 10762]
MNKYRNQRRTLRHNSGHFDELGARFRRLESPRLWQAAKRVASTRLRCNAFWRAIAGFRVGQDQMTTVLWSITEIEKIGRPHGRRCGRYMHVEGSLIATLPPSGSRLFKGLCVTAAVSMCSLSVHLPLWNSGACATGGPVFAG